MVPPNKRLAEVLQYLYNHSDYVTADDIITELRIPKPTVYQVLAWFMDRKYLDIEISKTGRVRIYKLRDNYRKWYSSAEGLSIPLSFKDAQLVDELRKSFDPEILDYIWSNKEDITQYVSTRLRRQEKAGRSRLQEEKIVQAVISAIKWYGKFKRTEKQYHDFAYQIIDGLVMLEECALTNNPHLLNGIGKNNLMFQ